MTMKYPGAFTFINRDTTNTPRIKNYKHDTAIATHVSRTRRRWTEEKRKVRLEQCSSERKLPVVKVKVVPLLPLFLPSHSAYDVKAIPREAATSARFSKVPVDLDSPSDQTANDHEHGRPSKCSQCSQVGPAILSSNRSSQTIPPIHVREGNSDPFSASPMPITAEIHELLELSSRFYVFWAWSVSTSSIFRAKAQESWLQSVRKALSVQGAAEMRVIVASGAAVKARLLAQAHHEDAKHHQEARLLEHKTRAFVQLRSDFQVALRLVCPTIFRLVSLEFHEGNFQAALWHHRAASEVTGRFKMYGVRRSGANQGNELYAVAEVWAAAAALQKATPCGMVDWSGERTASEDIGGVPQPPGSLFPHDLQWREIHPSLTPTTLRNVFLEIQELTLYMDQLSALDADGIEVYETVSYLGARSSAIRAEILTMFIDFDGSHLQRPTSDNDERFESLDDLVYSASCLAALLFINIIFMYRPNDRKTPTAPLEAHETRNLPTAEAATPLMSTAVNAQPLHRLQDLLQRMQRLLLQSKPLHTTMEDYTVDPELWTWLCFIAGLAEMLEAEFAAANTKIAGLAGVGTGLSLNLFRSCVNALGLRSWKDVRDLLRQFLYFGGLMDGYVVRMLELP